MRNSLGGRGNRTGVEPVAPSNLFVSGPGCAPTPRFPWAASPQKVPHYPSLTASADRALSALRHFPNFHEVVAPWFNPFGEGISMVG